jgi:hypothetical protein
LEGFHGSFDAAIVATDTDAQPVDTSLPAVPSEFSTPAAVPAADFAGVAHAATRTSVVTDTVFADFGSAPTAENLVAATPRLVAGEESHSIDLAMMAGLALALGGSWSTAARAEETRKYPALRN